ncbi:MltG/YceG/YrrL family protein [Calidifontibacillus oryziterrae]|uniref:endolytic transglycosylase MltG n=1 Tax=Calidifontibacillus oryziterrae TaxID=1191699 RepID=UPI000319AC34|nr:endolytic transglycosylase MltG [Calidifontibacillus oryziterrae]
MANNSLRSFASGMIIATSIFTAIYYFQPAEGGEKTIEEVRTITEEEVQQYLENKNYISIPKQTYEELMEKQNTTDLKSKDNPEATDKASEQLLGGNTAAGNEETSNNNKKYAEESTNSKPVTYKLEVVRGMNSIQIAKQLEKAGIVKSSEEFEQFLLNKKWNRSIQIGTYDLSNEMSYEEIGRIITKK